MDKIFLRELSAEAVIGIFDWERQVKQTVLIDLEIQADIRHAARTDRIEDTLNYKAVAKRVLAFVEASEFQLVETLSERIGRRGSSLDSRLRGNDGVRVGSALAMWKRLEGKPFGKTIFSPLICWKAPYFGSIRPRFEEFRPGYARVSMRKRRAVTNHIGTVHAIAMCNLAELAAGLTTEITIPPAMRWLPKGMAVEYLRKAETDVEAHAAVGEIAEGPGREVPVTVEVKDRAGELVCRAVITMWVAPRRKS